MAVQQGDSLGRRLRLFEIQAQDYISPTEAVIWAWARLGLFRPGLGRPKASSRAWHITSYRTDHIVILTSYLGQLYRLREALMIDNDPMLNDLTSTLMIWSVRDSFLLMMQKRVNRK